MLKIIVGIVTALVVVLGGVYFILQPRALPNPVLIQHPEGISQSTVNDARIRSSNWVSPDQTRVWVICRYGPGARTRGVLLIDLDANETLTALHGAALVGWIDDRNVLIYNQGRTESKWEEWLRLANPDAPIPRVTQVFTLDVVTGDKTKICEVVTTKSVTTMQLSTDRRRAVGAWGTDDVYEFEIVPDAQPTKLTDPYIWSPVWVGPDSYMFIGETAVHLREFGADRSQRFSLSLLQEIRDGLAEYGSPTIRICGRKGENVLFLDQTPKQNSDRLLVLDETSKLIADVARMVPSNDLPRFDPDGTMMVYQGRQFDRNMDTVYLQTVEPDSRPIELVTGTLGAVQESTPVFWRGDHVLYIHRGIEVRSISLAEGETQLHWPIAVVPN